MWAIVVKVLTFAAIIQINNVECSYRGLQPSVAPIYSDAENIVIPRRSLRFLDQITEVPHALPPSQLAPTLDSSETTKYIHFLEGLCSEMDDLVDAMKDSLTNPMAPSPGYPTATQPTSGMYLLSQFENPDQQPAPQHPQPGTFLNKPDYCI